MKACTQFRIALLTVCLTLGPSIAFVDLEVSATVRIHAKADFEGPLAVHGAWVQVGSYGRCWRPAGITVEWRPYCSGEWVWTDCGWYWVSDEPWAWACYHYGCWVYDSDYGWVWVPGVEWAPAWVTWRVGGGFVGWAPLTPSGRFFTRYPGPDLFVFVKTDHFIEPVRPTSVILKSKVAFSKTSEVGGIERHNLKLGGGSQVVVVNNGPGAAVIQKATGKTLHAVPISEAVRRTRAPADLKLAATDNKSKERHDAPVESKRNSEREDRDDTRGKDHVGPSSDGFFPSSGPGNGHGGGHGKGRG